jgi:hypothetical protein
MWLAIEPLKEQSSRAVKIRGPKLHAFARRIALYNTAMLDFPAPSRFILVLTEKLL